jgi:hypothetical protein
MRYDKLRRTLQLFVYLNTKGDNRLCCVHNLLATEATWGPAVGLFIMKPRPVGGGGGQKDYKSREWVVTTLFCHYR